MSATQEIQKLQSEGGEFWEKMWSEGHTGWHKDFVQEILKVSWKYYVYDQNNHLQQKKHTYTQICNNSVCKTIVKVVHVHPVLRKIFHNFNLEGATISLAVAFTYK